MAKKEGKIIQIQQIFGALECQFVRALDGKKTTRRVVQLALVEFPDGTTAVEPIIVDEGELVRASQIAKGKVWVEEADRWKGRIYFPSTTAPAGRN